MIERHHDVVIVGAGLAGLTLARHLLLDSGRTVLLLDRRAELPPARQKVGESTVQVGGYYLSKVLGLERHLMKDHFLKYNLRFYWKTPGRDKRALEDHSQAYIRPLSNVAGYQMDRNRLEAELLRLNSESPRFELRAPADDVEVELDGSGPPSVTFRPARPDAGPPQPRRAERITVTAGWVVDTSGRGKLLAGELDLERDDRVRHGAAFGWVDGLLDIEELTDRSRREVRLAPERARIGHLPLWLATNHFMGEGFWLWVIPLRDRTSLGVVYDSELFSRDAVSTPGRLAAWIRREFPLFEPFLEGREIVDYGSFRSFSHGCSQAISPERWAISGDAGRFLDPLYSPGCDFIAFHNTLIVDAILRDDRYAERPRTDRDDRAGSGDRSSAGARSGPGPLSDRCASYDRLLRALHEAYLPGYRISYGTLGDPEAFVLKYTWDLSVYFAFYVFPFVNELFTDRRFLVAFLRRFSRLGNINEGLQRFLADFQRWKKEHDPGSGAADGSRAAERPVATEGSQATPGPGATDGPGGPRPVLHDLMDLAPLRRAESTFYRVGVSVEEAREVLDEQLSGLEELGRYIVAHVGSVVAGDERLATDPAFVEGIDLRGLEFDPGRIRERQRSREAAGRRRDPGKPDGPGESGAPGETDGPAGSSRTGDSSGPGHPWTFDPDVLRRFRRTTRLEAAEP